MCDDDAQLMEQLHVNECLKVGVRDAYNLHAAYSTNTYHDKRLYIGS
jgi:hypothetical protein